MSPTLYYPLGELTTAFIPDEFPDGYAGHQLSAREREDLVAAAAAIAFEQARQLTLTLTLTLTLALSLTLALTLTLTRRRRLVLGGSHGQAVAARSRAGLGWA